MPMDLRAPLVMMDIEERSLEEIAEILDIPRGTAASRLRRARVYFELSVQRHSAKTAPPRQS
jgi:RNA polymerase sigma-70 factor, ECF subfamily